MITPIYGFSYFIDILVPWRWKFTSPLHKVLGAGFSPTKTLLIAFRTGYKRVSLFINLRVIQATGEVSDPYLGIRDGRGSVVPIYTIGKGPKYLTNSLIGKVRSYSTSSEKISLATVQEQSDIPKGLRILAKHWETCYKSPERIFYNLRGLLKQDSIWFAAYLKLKTNFFFLKYL